MIGVRGFTILLLLDLAGCAELVELRDEVKALRKEGQEQGKRIEKLQAQMEDGFRIALCRPEIRQLLEDVRKECSALPVTDPTKPPEMGICDTKKIKPAVISADPEHKGRFLKFMSGLRHEATYFRPSATLIIGPRRERLERLASQPLLHNTLFLIVAHPVPGEPNPEAEAMKRAQVIRTLMAQTNSGIDQERIFIWIYAFPVSKNEIDFPIDQPMQGEPADLNRSVWVFRADC